MECKGLLAGPAGPAGPPGPPGPLVLLPANTVSNIGTADGGSHDSVANSHDDFMTRSLDNVYSNKGLTGLPIVYSQKM